MGQVAIIGRAFDFQVLFVSSQGAGVAVVNPRMEVLKFTSGVKIVLLTTALNGGAEVGRYTFTWTIPSTLVAGDVLYAEMRGDDPSGVILVEQVLNVESEAASSSRGMTARFIR